MRRSKLNKVASRTFKKNFQNKGKLVTSSALLLLSTLTLSTAEAAWNPWQAFWGWDYNNKQTEKKHVKKDTPQQKSNSVYSIPPLPYWSPVYFSHVYASAIKSPLPNAPYDYNKNKPSGTIPTEQYDWNRYGIVGTYLDSYTPINYDNAFFQPLGENGRTCATCHETKSGMSLSVNSIRSRYLVSGGRDPLFAPVDGANCPNLVKQHETSGSLYGGHQGYGNSSFESSHSLLLKKGLFRIFLPVPDDAEFNIEVINDPTTCNTDPLYSQVSDEYGNSKQIISVYRRPIMSANLKFKTDTLTQNADGNSGNIMSDGREPSLRSQAINATLGHAQALEPPTDAQVDEIVSFESNLYSAQIYNYSAGWLNSGGANAGPEALSQANSGVFDIAAPFDEFTNWIWSYNPTQSSIARGQQIFNSRNFTVSNVSGFNDAVNDNDFTTGTCGTCHNIKHSGTDALANAQRDIGIGGQAKSFGGPAPTYDLPVFRVTCKEGFSHPFNKSQSILTNDPGRALISGKCADIGAKTVPGLRALAVRAPYFSDGSAANLWDVVNFYNRRFNIGLNYQEKADLVNFMKAL